MEVSDAVYARNERNRKFRVPLLSGCGSSAIKHMTMCKKRAGLTRAQLISRRRTSTLAYAEKRRHRQQPMLAIQSEQHRADGRNARKHNKEGDRLINNQSAYSPAGNTNCTQQSRPPARVRRRILHNVVWIMIISRVLHPRYRSDRAQRNAMS